VEAGFQVIKLKIGGIDFEDELRLLSALREKYNDRILIRLDANGAFTRDVAMQKLKRLAEFDIHSIEQPIKAGQPIEMQALCSESPIAIALDEELIGVNNNEQKDELLETIRPPFIILKPTLHGGITGCEEWITLAEHKGVNWWATSALESNIGLNAIAQWLATKQISLPQGLGTGGLYSNNFHPAWDVSQGYLKFNNIQELNQDIILLK
jgi:L-alanine-DL-glutamate epimerase-like enolase superfamily enzyme